MKGETALVGIRQPKLAHAGSTRDMGSPTEDRLNRHASCRVARWTRWALLHAQAQSIGDQSHIHSKNSLCRTSCRAVLPSPHSHLPQLHAPRKAPGHQLDWHPACQPP